MKDARVTSSVRQYSTVEYFFIMIKCALKMR